MSDNRITVFIKMKPFLKAFLISIFGEEPLFIPQNNDGIYFSIIEKYLRKPKPTDVIPNTTDKQNYIEIILPYYKHTNITSRNFLSQNSQKIIECRAEDLFWEAYYQHMTDSFNENITITNSIVHFIEKYNLPYDDKIEDMLRKSIYRRKKLIFQRPIRQYVKKI